METQPQASATSAVVTPELTPAEQNIARHRKRNAVAAALRLKRRERSADSGWAAMERQMRMTSLMSLARRAVRRAVAVEPRSFAQRLRRERLLRKWTGYSKDMASMTRSGGI